MRLLPALVRDGGGKPPGPPPGFDALGFFSEMTLNDWEEAEIKSVVHYLRGGTRLACPAEWKAAFPEFL